MTINHLVNSQRLQLDSDPYSCINADEWESDCRDLYAREKRIKTNSAVKINLTAYKNCHNYHLNAIVLPASFIFTTGGTTLSDTTKFQANIIKIYSRRYPKAIKALKSNLWTG